MCLALGPRLRGDERLTGQSDYFRFGGVKPSTGGSDLM
jgi:hypothetical protein